MSRIIIALDSFKGCMSSHEAGMAAAEGARLAQTNTSVLVFPLSDGGEGLSEVLTHAMCGQMVQVMVHGPLMEPLMASYGLVESPDTKGGLTAIIEMAAACGLTLLSPEKRNPEFTTTYGFGEMILDAVNRGCTRLILGIGGSSTNDAGIGMLQALGAIVQFDSSDSSQPDTSVRAINSTIYLPSGTPLFTGASLLSVSNIDTTPLHHIYNNVEILVACDVQNPLCGPHGAAYIFAPQKGADTEAVIRLDIGLKHILEITHCETLPGDGAAGGLGFALRHFLHGSMQPGIELVLSQLHFDSFLPEADLIITGEGKSDAQTLMGKVPMGVLHHSQKFSKPVHLIAGRIEDAPLLLQTGFTDVHCINDDDEAPFEELIKPAHACQNIRKTVANIINNAL